MFLSKSKFFVIDFSLHQFYRYDFKTREFSDNRYNSNQTKFRENMLKKKKILNLENFEHTYFHGNAS